MAVDPVHRRLSAILAADVAGYSRLMALDEAETLSRFKKIRSEVLDPTIAQFGGRVVGTAGDSLLVEFTSSLSAVECAVHCQQVLRQANSAEVEPRRILFRMGVNLGDVIADNETIHGDGVNVAARLEKLADPGGLCIARNVFELIEGKLSISFTDLGDHHVKNIAKPVRVYRADLDALVSSTIPTTPAKSIGSGEVGKVSVAVLPFDNMSGDPEQAYFSDGIIEDIITELSKFRELLVIARNSSFHFRGKSTEAKDVAMRLGVRFLVEGSVRKVGKRVRVTAQLIEGASASHVWADRYDRDLDDIFAIQDEITRTVVARVAAQAQLSVAKYDRCRPTESLSAYDWYLKARDIFNDIDANTLNQSEEFARRAVELDPDFATAHAILSDIATVHFLYSGQPVHLDRALEAAQKALRIASEEPWANYAFGLALLFSGRLDEARHYLERAIDLNPNNLVFQVIYANWMFLSGRYKEAMTKVSEAIRFDPYSYDWFWPERAIAETTAGEYQEAVETFRRAKYLPPWSLCYLAVCNVQLGKLPEARLNVQDVAAAVPRMQPSDYFARITPFADKAKLQFFVEALRKAEVGDKYL